MKIIAPFELTGAMLTSSTVPENDHAEWAAGTAYSVGQKVIRLTTHKAYEALTASTGKVPEDSPTDWLDLGATNRWAMFDQKVGTSTTATTSMTYVFAVGQIVQAIGFMDLANVTSINVTVTDSVDGVVYNTTKVLPSIITASNWWHYFFDPIQRRTVLYFTDLPSYRNAAISITITGDSGATIGCGVCMIGRYYEFADAVRIGASIGIQDYSRKEVDDWGNYEIIERAFAKRANWDLWVDRPRMDLLFTTLASLRAKPALYIGGEIEDATAVYGFPKDWGVVIEYPFYVQCSIDLEGLI